MNAFIYKDGILHAEGVPLPHIAAAVGTPVYVYAKATLLDRYRTLADALSGQGVRVYYAVKANSNLAVIATLARAGAGADVVSIGEMRRAMAAGVPASDILFAGVGKTAEELGDALSLGVRQINVESESELRLLSDVASGMGATARIGLRVNPDVDAKTHAKITTGRKENKFGVPIERAPAFFRMAAQLPGVEATSLSVHIGSQLRDIAPYAAAYARLAEMTRTLRAEGFTIDHLDLGGGLGVDYDATGSADVPAYADAVREHVSDLGCELSVEPGRFIVADAGVLLTRVVHVKDTEHKRFVVVDGAMNDLIRPTLYEAYHDIVTVQAPLGAPHAVKTDIVGPICESGDFLGQARSLPAVEGGDLIAVKSAGAYGAVMSSTYNTRPLVPEVLVDGDDFHVVRRRQTLEEIWALDSIPDTLRQARP